MFYVVALRKCRGSEIKCQDWTKELKKTTGRLDAGEPGEVESKATKECFWALMCVCVCQEGVVMFNNFYHEAASHGSRTLIELKLRLFAEAGATGWKKRKLRGSTGSSVNLLSSCSHPARFAICTHSHTHMLLVRLLPPPRHGSQEKKQKGTQKLPWLPPGPGTEKRRQSENWIETRSRKK